MITEQRLEYYFGKGAALVPFALFIIGVITVALMGAPSEKSFWPILFLALTTGMLLAKDKTAFGEIVFEGMSQKMVPLMIMAWITASCIGILMADSGLVDALIALGMAVSINGPVYVLITLLICCIVSLSTGSSFATILICGPILYYAGGQLGAPLPVLAGAIIGGATFGDFIAPVSDTTIASAVSMHEKIGDVVKSRIRIVIPALLIAIGLYVFASVRLPGSEAVHAGPAPEADYKGLVMLLAPVLIIFFFIKGYHILFSLLTGLAFGVILALVFGLIPVERVFSLDTENFTATSFIIDGVDRALGISVFTLLLMGLVSTVLASGIIQSGIERVQQRIHTGRQAGIAIAGVTSMAVLLTTHSIVAILSVKDVVSQLSQRHRFASIRAANIMSLMACTYPFLLPYFVPVLLMVNITGSSTEFGIEGVTALEAGMYNFVSWGLLIISLLYIFQRKKRHHGQEVEAGSV